MNACLQIIGILTQNPAGLKLNEPLNLALATFFRYHVYLWQSNGVNDRTKLTKSFSVCDVSTKRLYLALLHVLSRYWIFIWRLGFERFGFAADTAHYVL